MLNIALVLFGISFILTGLAYFGDFILRNVVCEWLIKISTYFAAAGCIVGIVFFFYTVFGGLSHI